MRNFIVIFTLLISNSFAGDLSEKKSVTDSGAILSKFEIKNDYSQFLNSISKYNKKRKNIADISKVFKNPQEQRAFYTWMKSNSVTYLPKATIVRGVAIIKLGPNTIKLSLETLQDNFFYVNEKRVEIKKQSFNDLRKKYASTRFDKKTKMFSFINLIISNAVAESLHSARFEKTLMAALIALEKDFSSPGWCVSCEDEYLEASTKNFKKLMGNVDRMLFNCENGTKSEDLNELYTNIGYYKNYEDSNGGFVIESVNKLEDYFPTFKGKLSNLTCQSAVETFFIKEDDKGFFNKTKKDLRFTTTREAQRKEKVAEIKRHCDHISGLMSCIVKSDYRARDVYDASRKKENAKPYNRRKRLPIDYDVKGYGQ